MSDAVNNNNKNPKSFSTQKTSIKSTAKTALKALVPMVAMAAPVANASVRSLGSVSQQGKKGKAKAVVHVSDNGQSKDEINLSSLTISGSTNAIQAQPKHSAFSAFGGASIGKATTKRQPSHAALDFLTNNGLLDSGELIAGKISGDTGGKFGKKTFLGAGYHLSTSYHAYSWCGQYTYVSSPLYTGAYSHLTSITSSVACGVAGGNWFTYYSDTTPPVVTSVTASGGHSAQEGYAAFTVYFDDYAYNVTSDDFTLTTVSGSVTGNIANVAEYYDYAYVYINNLSGTGSIRLDLNANTDIVDDYGNGNGTNGFTPAFSSGSTHNVDTDVPSVSSITVSGSPAQNAASMDFVVDFDDGAYNISTDDFTVTTASGTASGTVNSVSGASGDPITVNVSSITGTGSIRLDLNGYTDITDIYGNGDGNYGAYAPFFTSGSTHSVDRDAPVLSEYAAVSTPTADSTPDVTINVGEAGTLSIGGSCGSAQEGAIGTGNQVISLTQPDNSTPLATGTFTDCTATVTDAAGNASTPLALTSFSVDVTAPRISDIIRQTPATSPTNVDTLIWTVAFNEDVLNLGSTDFTVSGTTATITNVNQTGSAVYDLTVSGGDLASLDATATLGLAGGQNITDLLGNALVNPTPTTTNDSTFVVDNSGPVPTITAPATTVGAFAITVTFDEAVTGFTSGEISVTNGNLSDFAGSGTTYTATVTPVSIGINTVVSIAASVALDAATNLSVAATDAVVSNNREGKVKISGNTVEGQTLTATLNDGDGTTTSTPVYQWTSGGSSVGGNSATYVVQASDVGNQIAVNVTYEDDLGFAGDVTSDDTSTVLNLLDGALSVITQGVGAGYDGTTTPTVEDFENAGITGVTEEILALVTNAVIKEAFSLDDKEELQTLIDEVLEGQDDDGDGIPNIVEGDADKDSEGDGIADRDDTDSDNDGISDTVESGLDQTDTDEDGIIDVFDADVDGDGEVDAGKTDYNHDGVDNDLDTLAKIVAKLASVNGDSDSWPNHLDLDADNDGIADVSEAGHIDADSDAFLDSGDSVITDKDLLPDTDADGIPDYLDRTSDGINNDITTNPSHETLDTNGDGEIDSTSDSDGDGIRDVVDGAVGAGSATDVDGDGVANSSDDDADGDGIPNLKENPGLINFTGFDDDGDGIDDGIDADVNGETFGADSDANGVQDDLELIDTDGDGTADWLDADDDGDGIPTSEEEVVLGNQPPTLDAKSFSFKSTFPITYATRELTVGIDSLEKTGDPKATLSWTTNSRIQIARLVIDDDELGENKIEWELEKNTCSSTQQCLEVDAEAIEYDAIEKAFYLKAGNLITFRINNEDQNLRVKLKVRVFDPTLSRSAIEEVEGAKIVSSSGPDVYIIGDESNLRGMDIEIKRKPDVGSLAPMAIFGIGSYFIMRVRRFKQVRAARKLHK